VLLKMVRELQKELQLSPRTDGSLSPVPAPMTQGGRGDAKQKPPQVAGLQLRDGAAEERQLFLLTSLPRVRMHPLQRQRCFERWGSEGTTPGWGSLPVTWALNHLFWGGHSKFGCRSLSKCVFGEKAPARTRLRAGGRGLSREHCQVTASKGPTSHGPGEVSVRDPAALLALATEAESRTSQGRGRHETKEQEGHCKRQRETFRHTDPLQQAKDGEGFISTPVSPSKSPPPGICHPRTQVSASAPPSPPKSKLGH